MLFELLRPSLPELARKNHICAKRPNPPLYVMNDDVWKAEVRVMTGLLRSHLLQVGAVLTVTSESSKREHYPEQAALNHRLQAHIQTIQTLQAENTELHSALSQSDQAAKQKAVETIKVKSRLKALSEKNSNPKKQLPLANKHTHLQEKNSKVYIKEIVRRNMGNYNSGEQVNGLMQEHVELCEKL